MQRPLLRRVPSPHDPTSEWSDRKVYFFNRLPPGYFASSVLGATHTRASLSPGRPRRLVDSPFWVGGGGPVPVPSVDPTAQPLGMPVDVERRRLLQRAMLFRRRAPGPHEDSLAFRTHGDPPALSVPLAPWLPFSAWLPGLQSALCPWSVRRLNILTRASVPVTRHAPSWKRYVHHRAVSFPFSPLQVAHIVAGSVLPHAGV